MQSIQIRMAPEGCAVAMPHLGMAFLPAHSAVRDRVHDPLGLRRRLRRQEAELAHRRHRVANSEESVDPLGALAAERACPSGGVPAWG